MRSLIAVLILCLFYSLGLSQDSKVDTSKWNVEIRSNIAQLYGNGDFEVFDSPFAIGVDYKGVQDLTFGFYLAPVIANVGDENMSTLSAFFHFTMLKRLGIGAGSIFWKGFEDGGFVKPTKENIFLTLNFEVK
jgi:hypothetical protein